MSGAISENAKHDDAVEKLSVSQKAQLGKLGILSTVAEAEAVAVAVAVASPMGVVVVVAVVASSVTGKLPRDVVENVFLIIK